jgi:hypothetical protein
MRCGAEGYPHCRFHGSVLFGLNQPCGLLVGFDEGRPVYVVSRSIIVLHFGGSRFVGSCMRLRKLEEDQSLGTGYA